MISGGVF